MSVRPPERDPSKQSYFYFYFSAGFHFKKLIFGKFRNFTIYSESPQQTGGASSKIQFIIIIFKIPIVICVTFSTRNNYLLHMENSNKISNNYSCTLGNCGMK